MEEERFYTIPLRKAFRASKRERAPKAVRIVRSFLQKHMKSDTVIIGKSVNEYIWSKGITNCPRRVKIHAKKDDNNRVLVELVGVDIKEPERALPKTEKKTEIETEVAAEDTKTAETTEEDLVKEQEKIEDAMEKQIAEAITEEPEKKAETPENKSEGNDNNKADSVHKKSEDGGEK